MTRLKKKTIETSRYSSHHRRGTANKTNTTKPKERRWVKTNIKSKNSGTTLFIDPELFWEPALKGFDGLHAPIYCFLVSNGDRHIVFDLGVRLDWENYPPAIVSLIKKTTIVKPGKKDIAGMLDSEDDDNWPGIRSKDVEAVIWSHNHFDHVGDPSTFPPTTAVVVGPGVTAASWPAYPTNPNGIVLDSDADGRTIREVNFDAGLRIGSFRAMDYFGDGSFYLLDAPGHAVGHLCALARVTSSPSGSSFVFLGADACHHAGVLRPSEYLPLPETIRPSPFSRYSDIGCPGQVLQRLNPQHSAVEPFFKVSRKLFPNHEEALATVRKIEELDASEDIFVILAHDISLKGKIDFYPQTVNNWKERNLRSETRWLFCKDFEGSIVN